MRSLYLVTSAIVLVVVILFGLCEKDIVVHDYGLRHGVAATGIDEYYPESNQKADSIALPTYVGVTYYLKEYQVSEAKREIPSIFPKENNWIMRIQEIYDIAAAKGVYTDREGRILLNQIYYFALSNWNHHPGSMEQRKKLQRIFMMLDRITLCETLGESACQRQISDLLVAAEYELYLLSLDTSVLEDKFDIARQKQLFIESVRQWLKDEGNHFIGNSEESRRLHDRELRANIDTLADNITGLYYLNQAKEYFRMLVLGLAI